MKERLQQYQTEVTQELINNILPFYLDHAVDREHGGFYGLIANDLTVKPDAPKSLILNCRILWTFAQAYRLLGDPAYLDIADRAYHYLLHHFWDGDYGGLYWLLDYQGKPLDTRKMGYGQAFGIYSLSEYYRAAGQQESLDRATALFQWVEQHSYDSQQGGYFDGHQHDWTEWDGLSVDLVPAAKTMNTHLHLLEAYTNLLRAWPNASLRRRLLYLLELTLDHIINPTTAHFWLQFDAAWQPLSDHISYGHDIEGSWLLVEAAEMLDDSHLWSQTKEMALSMAQVTYDKGRDADGSLFYEGDSTGVANFNKEWWPQTEAMVGFLNAYQLTHKLHFLEASLQSWQFARQYLVDKQYGEWFQTITPEGRPLDGVKTGPWKGPYHNGRACMEIIQRVKHLTHYP